MGFHLRSKGEPPANMGRAMARMLLFFVVVIFCTRVLARVPVVGAIFQIPFLGFWFTAILLSGLAAKLGSDAVDYSARRRLVQSLGSVDTPHHKGKLGALLLSQGRARKAIPLLEAAVEGDATSLEWRYQLGLARLRGKADASSALAAFDSVLAEDDDFKFGAAMLMSAEAALAAGYPDNALLRVGRFERDQGPSPSSALLRAKVLKKAGRRAESNAALDELPGLFKRATKREASRSWAIRLWALVLRLIP